MRTSTTAQSLESLAAPEQIRIGDLTYTYRIRIGTGASAIFRTEDGTHVVKIFPTKLRWLVDYEYWATQYLREKGVNVLDVTEPPFTTREIGPQTRSAMQAAHKDSQDYVVLVKPYVQGATGDAMRNFSEVRYNRRPGDYEILNAAIHDLDRTMGEIAKYFSNDAFIHWLQAKGFNVNEIAAAERGSELLRHGDLKPANFLHTPKGWILIDP